MKILTLSNLFLLLLLAMNVSCASVGKAVVGGLVPGVTLNFNDETRTVYETRTVHESKSYQNVNIVMPKNVEPKRALAEVPEIGIKETKVYFYAQ